MTRIMFPFLLLVALAAQAMGVLNACNRFAVPALASTFFNIGSVAFGLVLRLLAGAAPGYRADHRHGHRRGAGRRSAIDLATAMRCGRRLPFPSRLRLEPSALRKIFRLMGPAILGNAAVQINVLVITNFASPHSRQRSGELAGLLVPFHAASAGIVRRRHRVRHASFHFTQRGRWATSTNSAARSPSRLGMVFLLTLPSSVGLIVLGRSMIGAIYQGGKFQRLRHAANRARALLLCRRSGRIRRAQSAESRVLRAA